MAKHHRHKAHGGGAEGKKDGAAQHAEVDYGNMNVIREAKKKKHGGKVHGHKGHHRLDKRARGGGVGADKHPFSSAHRGG